MNQNAPVLRFIPQERLIENDEPQTDESGGVRGVAGGVAQAGSIADLDGAACQIGETHYRTFTVTVPTSS